MGLLGGGVATTNWLIKRGAHVTVTDLKDENYLESSLRRLKGRPKLRLNGHDKKDIEDNEIIVFNPDVSVNNPFVKYAQKVGRQIENEATIFYKLCPKPIVAVTGTRGKTTTANWIGHFLNQAKHRTIVTGNSYVKPLLKTLDRIARFDYIVNEVPSYHLEFFSPAIPAPEIAVITNLYQDHLNRHDTMEDYALAKALVFKNQSISHNLILNYDNDWTPFFLKQKPRAKVWFFSLLPLPKRMGGAFYKNDKIYFQKEDSAKVGVDIKGFVAKWGGHNLQNLLAGSLAAYLGGVSWMQIQKKIKTLPQVPFRQEVVYKNKRLKIINDTSATSPDGGIAAINRFAGPTTILITGGTDRQLDYSQWAKIVTQKLKPENVIFLAGSATDKMLKLLRPYFAKASPDTKVLEDKSKGGKISVFDSLAECLQEAIKKHGNFAKSVILFSPAAKSFEKFKNEFDRGRQFNLLVKKLIKN